MTTEIRKFLKGETVKIRSEFQDDGDDKFTWVVFNDEEKGRVDISAINSPLQDFATKWMWSYNHDRPNMTLG